MYVRIYIRENIFIRLYVCTEEHIFATENQEVRSREGNGPVNLFTSKELNLNRLK